MRAIEQGRTTRDIADQFDIGKSTVEDIHKRYKERNNRISLKSGRPQFTSERQDKILIRSTKNDPRKSAVLLNAEMKEFYKESKSTLEIC